MYTYTRHQAEHVLNQDQAKASHLTVNEVEPRHRIPRKRRVRAATHLAGHVLHNVFPQKRFDVLRHVLACRGAPCKSHVISFDSTSGANMATFQQVICKPPVLCSHFKHTTVTKLLQAHHCRRTSWRGAANEGTGRRYHNDDEFRTRTAWEISFLPRNT